VAHFVIGQERDCHEVYTSLLKLSQPGIWGSQFLRLLKCSKLKGSSEH